MARVRVLVREPRLEPSAPSRVLDVDVDVDVRTDETFRSITSVSMESRALDPPSRADADAVVPRAWIPPPARRRNAARLNALSLGPPRARDARDVARVAHAAFGVAHAIVLALARVATASAPPRASRSTHRLEDARGLTTTRSTREIAV